MDEHIKQYVEHLMVPVPKGTELISIYKDSKKWLSSDSKMSIPGSKRNLTKTQVYVQLESFLIGKYPVTKNLYEAVTHQKTFDSTQSSEPMVNVSWEEAVLFCNTLSHLCGFQRCYNIDQNDQRVTLREQANGFRLPTDAQWQYACKAGAMGYTYGEIGEIGWYNKNANEHVHAVGEKDPNNWGLYDMIGNVWEWCWDLYDEEIYGTYRIFRGGSWAEEERSCGATSRRRGHPSFGIDDLGFRLARSK